MAYIKERDGRFQVTIRVAGKRLAKTFNTHIEAQAWADTFGQREETDHKNMAVHEALRAYLSEAVPKQKSQAQQTQIINQLLRECAWVSLPFGELSTSVIRKWRDERLEVVSPSSIARYMDVIRAACRYVELEHDASTQLPMIQRVKIQKPPQQEVQRPTKQMLERIMWSADQAEVRWLRPVIEFALETAMRRSEITSLTWKNVDLDKKLIRVADTKNGYDRTIPMSPKAAELLEEQRIVRGILLESATDETVWGISPNQLTKCWQRCRKRADVDMRFHDLRHEAASRYFEMGMSPIEVATMTGHRTMSQVMRYSHADLNQIAAKWGQ